jgi:endo-1,4-beta-xylanase
MKKTTSGFPLIINFRIAGSCFLVLLASCKHVGPSSPAHSSPTPNPEFTLSPSASPFQPENPVPTPTASATLELSVTPTSSATIDPNLNGTLRYSADRIGFGIGTVYQSQEAHDPLFPSVVNTDINTLMMTTFMKKTQPARDRWDWSVADDALDLGLANGQKIIGGPLVYDNQTVPAWLKFDRPDCGAWTAAELEGILQEYIQTVVARFRGQVAAWEVVNEPLTSGDNCWRHTLVDRYIGRAFRHARAADPDARLFLNEAFGRAGVDKDPTDQLFSLVKSLKEAGVPLDAVGIQMHLSAEILRSSYPNEFRYFLRQARNAGVKVMITEMDVYQGPPGHFPDPLGVQKQIFNIVTRTCLSFPDCTDLLVWSVSDRYTWLAHLSGNNFIDPQPLLFDGQFGQKPAYFGVLEALQETGAGGGQ